MYDVVHSFAASARSSNCLLLRSSSCSDHLQYIVALRQPSVIYVKVNSLRFSSRASSCSVLKRAYGKSGAILCQAYALLGRNVYVRSRRRLRAFLVLLASKSKQWLVAVFLARLVLLGSKTSIQQKRRISLSRLRFRSVMYDVVRSRRRLRTLLLLLVYRKRQPHPVYNLRNTLLRNAHRQII